MKPRKQSRILGRRVPENTEPLLRNHVSPVAQLETLSSLGTLVRPLGGKEMAVLAHGAMDLMTAAASRPGVPAASSDT